MHVIKFRPASKLNYCMPINSPVLMSLPHRLVLVGLRMPGSFLYLLSSSLAWLCLFFLMLCPALLQAQQISLKGHISTTENESLPFATVLVLPDSTILLADEAGNFSVKLKPGAKTVKITYTGYTTLHAPVVLQKDTFITYTLRPSLDQLQEVTITANP